MTTKLTLSIESKSVEKIKRISRRKGMSVSKMVVKLFDELDSPSKKNTSSNTNSFLKYRGIVKGKALTTKEITNERYETLLKKHSSK